MLPAELTLGMVAKMLGCSVASVRRRVKRGELKGHLVGTHLRVYLHELKKNRDLWDAIECRASLGG